jgi:hypothetical protein
MLLVIDQEGQEVLLMLTRRLVARLINGIAGILERSSVAASRAPSDVRGDVVMLEHRGVLAGGSAKEDTRSPRRQPQASTGRKKPAIVTSINIKIGRRNFEIVLNDARQQVASISVVRPDMHRILNLLRDEAEKADWEIRVETGWLKSETSTLVLN